MGVCFSKKGEVDEKALGCNNVHNYRIKPNSQINVRQALLDAYDCKNCVFLLQYESHTPGMYERTEYSVKKLLRKGEIITHYVNQFDKDRFLNLFSSCKELERDYLLEKYSLMRQNIQSHIKEERISNTFPTIETFINFVEKYMIEHNIRIPEHEHEFTLLLQLICKERYVTTCMICLEEVHVNNISCCSPSCDKCVCYYCYKSMPYEFKYLYLGSCGGSTWACSNMCLYTTRIYMDEIEPDSLRYVYLKMHTTHQQNIMEGMIFVNKRFYTDVARIINDYLNNDNYML